MKNIILFIPLLLLLACSSNQKKELILSEEKMIDVLLDVQLSEAYFRTNDPMVKSDDFKTPAPSYYNHIFEKHQITKLQFDESMKFYQKDLPTFKMLYDSVAQRMELLKLKK